MNMVQNVLKSSVKQLQGSIKSFRKLYLSLNFRCYLVLLCCIFYTNLSIANQPDTNLIIQKLANIDWSNQKAFENFDAYIEEVNVHLSTPTLIHNYKRAFQEVKRINNDSLSYFYAKNLSTLFDNMEDYVKAQEYLELALSYAKKLNDEDRIIITLNSLGFIQSFQTNYVEAVNTYLEAIEMAKAKGSTREYLIYSNLSFCYGVMGQLEEAIDLMKKSTQYYEDNDVRHKEYHLLSSYRPLLELFKMTENEDSVLVYVDKLIEHAPKLEKDSLFEKYFSSYGYALSQAYSSLTNFYIDKSDKVQAQLYYDKYGSIKFLEASDTYMLDVRIAMLNGEMNKAKQLIENPPQVIVNKKRKGEYSLLAAEYYEQTGDYKKSLEFFKQSSDEEMSSLKSNVVNINKFTNVNLENVKNKHAISQLQKDKIIQEKRNLLSTSISIFVVAILILLFHLYKQTQKKNKLLKGDLKNKMLIEKQTIKLKKADEQKINLFVNIAHEFQTPLSIIIGLSQKVHSNTTDNTNELYLNIIRNNGNVLSERVNQILEFSKLKSYKPQVNNTYFYLNELIEQTCTELYHRAYQKNIRLSFTQNENDLILNSDIKKLKTILKNLIDNAIKYSDLDTEVEVSVKEENAKLTIFIKDHGAGISEESIVNLFDRFYQTTTDNLEGGFGIGLSICKEYIDLLEGKIEVESTLGVGSIFKVEIPTLVTVGAIEASEITRLETPVINPMQEVEKSNNQDLERNNILIVEDNHDFFVYLNSILQKEYNIGYVSNGKEALEYLKENTVDLILTDWMMPEKNGLDLVLELKKNSMLKQIPVILITARNLVSDQIKAVKNGVGAYLTKPLDENVLLAKISHLINRKKDGKLNDEPVQSYKNSILKDFELSKVDRDWIYNFEKLVFPQITNFDLNLSLIAEPMGVSLTQLNNKVKRITGLTAMRFIQELRFWEARRMLEENNADSVKMACLSVGFKDIKNFSRNFKKRF